MDLCGTIARIFNGVIIIGQKPTAIETTVVVHSLFCVLVQVTR